LIAAKEVSIHKGINIVEDFRRLPRSVNEGIAGIFRIGATKAGDEKTVEIDTFIYRLLLRYIRHSDGEDYTDHEHVATPC
jgi:hypothetical protein